MPERPAERKGLGRGLSALMADVLAPAETGTPDTRGAREIPIARIHPNGQQPRRDFPPEALAELAESIRQKGVLQPVIVRPRAGSDEFELVAGERRWRAAQAAGLAAIPAVVRALSDAEVLEVAIVENIQRSDLNAMEEAAAYAQLVERFGHTQEQIAAALSKSRSHIANLMRLLKLPEPIQAHVRSGALSAGHARALIGAPQAAALARRAIETGMSVREIEKAVRDAAEGGGRGRAERRRDGPGAKDADTRTLEADLSAALGMPVSIDHEAGGERGRLSIGYATLAELDTLCRLLSAGQREDEG